MRDLFNQRFLLADIRVDALERIDLIQLINDANDTRQKSLILHHNLHSLYLHETDGVLKAIYAGASWVYIDGLPLVWLARLAGLPLTRAHRVTFLDSFDAILDEAETKGWRVFYLGSTPEVLARGIRKLQAMRPMLAISGNSGFFDHSPSVSDEIVSRINAFKTDLLFVGMGMPLQEKWIAEHFSQIQSPAIVTSGATLDYVTGDAYRPPAWAGPLGLYGLCRLISDPRRLWKRYLFEPLIVMRFLAIRLLRQRLQHLNQGPIEVR